ncbi:sodium:proton antiporter [Oleiphilus sp. HI0009]|uniref:sodium:proton antiporter NhaD n=2 Tax=Oleiphilus TaxID=141450 RepID=UPI0007C31943|nr:MULTISPECIES: sodium:proton antiporter NhaD [unclassified Oleiphilus]KZX76644.1 sodium:proton antiporter [Oleiphilus sp. HI0009]KZY63964.1 sodium:proton antiporter [Oleiphilus sp. HI0066]KZY67362.1 sodium:proton antiporter [Oleiphilus sp. HI0067]
MQTLKQTLSVMMLMLIATSAAAAGGGEVQMLDLTATWLGGISIAIFVFAYMLVIGEEYLHLRKSKPVMVAAGIIWILVAISYNMAGDTTSAHVMIQHNILEYAELLLFLLAAMTYVNTMQERNVFAALRSYLVSKGFSLKAIFWITGALAFVISPIADNLTTALVMAAVVMAVGGSNAKFIGMGCINIVVAANAGGAFSPFGDITTLMVWQKGLVEFTEFFALLVPSIVNWLVPALLMSLFLPKGQPEGVDEAVTVKKGGIVVIFLFLGTIAMAVSFHSVLHLPSMVGMMTGLGVLKIYGYYLKITGENTLRTIEQHAGISETEPGTFDIFDQLQRAEWDTLMFFYGVVLCVGGLSAFGYLNLASIFMYEQMGASWANILVGVLSAIVDNIPVMFAVLTMLPDMSVNQWLLVTLTAGVGGSMLSIGSAAGVALMGQARGYYTFFSHLKWTWAIALGYVASIAVHFWISDMPF